WNHLRSSASSSRSYARRSPQFRCASADRLASMTDAPMLEVRNLDKTYQSRGRAVVKAVDDVSFAVEPGQIFTLLGPSGCGKTTTLRSIAGLETPDTGEILVS